MLLAPHGLEAANGLLGLAISPGEGLGHSPFRGAAPGHATTESAQGHWAAN